jgi:hypothetical protein
MTQPSSGPALRAATATADAGRRDRRPVVFGALGALVLTATGLLLLTGGSEATDAALAAPPAAPAASITTATPSARPSATPPSAEAEVRAGRDPFEVLRDASASVPVATGADADAQPATGAGGPAAVAVPASAVPAPPAAAAPASPPAQAAPAAPALAEQTLSLLAVERAGTQRTAVFTLDGTSLRAQVGARFGPDAALRLVSLRQEPDFTGWSAVVQHAGGTTFDVTTGRHAHLP